MSRAASRRIQVRDLTVPLLLVALSVVPMIGGAIRLASLSAPPTPESARFVAAPAPVVLHILAATVYCLLGAFQFSRAVRNRWPGWHRRAGRVLAAAGLVAGLTGLWMTHFYAIPAGMQGSLLHAVRLLVGAGMVAAIVLAWRSILRRDVARHEAWLIRAYALGQGAGTQVLVLGPWTAITGDSQGLTRDLLMALAWGINGVVAEWIVSRRAPSVQREVSLA